MFPGQYYDQETGLHYNYFRDYNPSLGRYLQPDPIGMWGGINPFGYVKNNPINKTDPLGLFVWVNPLTYWGDFYRGARDFTKNYQDMRDAKGKTISLYKIMLPKWHHKRYGNK